MQKLHRPFLFFDDLLNIDYQKLLLMLFKLKKVKHFSSGGGTHIVDSVSLVIPHLDHEFIAFDIVAQKHNAQV